MTNTKSILLSGAEYGDLYTYLYSVNKVTRPNTVLNRVEYRPKPGPEPGGRVEYGDLYKAYRGRVEYIEPSYGRVGLVGTTFNLNKLQ